MREMMLTTYYLVLLELLLNFGSQPPIVFALCKPNEVASRVPLLDGLGGALTLKPIFLILI
jgi:hypothetical protein